MSWIGNDAVTVAYQTGRLDFVSALLAIIAIILGVAAIPVFWVLKWRAERVARETVAELTAGVAERAEREAISKMEELLPILVEQYMELVQNRVAADAANQIANAQEEPGDAAAVDIPNDPDSPKGGAG